MFKSEKQFTLRASKIALEETFMNIDTPDTSFDPFTGYRFGYPQNWLANPSEQKMIGLRSLKITPSSHMILLNLNITTPALDPIPSSVTADDSIPLNWLITKNDTLEVIFQNLADLVARAYPEPVTVEAVQYLPRFNYGYDQSTGQLQMIVRDMITNNQLLPFYFEDPDTADKTNFAQFTYFMNQTDIPTVETIINTSSTIKTFPHVWDRENLFFHASFSTSRRNLIGQNNDFWQTPSKKYLFRDNTNDFYVSFSTDGVHKIFPYYCKFYLELTFILNYERSLT